MVTGEVDADTAIVPADVLSKQALEGQAEDLALEDALYSLDKALQANSLTPEVYIKQVRPLNRACTTTRPLQPLNPTFQDLGRTC